MLSDLVEAAWGYEMDFRWAGVGFEVVAGSWSEDWMGWAGRRRLTRMGQDRRIEEFLGGR